MKRHNKFLISMLVCFSIVLSLCVPVFANESKNQSELPPGMTLLEGEIWVPAGSEAIPFGENDECGHYFPGYTYIGYKKGDTNVEMDVASTLITIGSIASGGGIGIAFTVADIIIQALYKWNPAGSYQGMYKVETYYNYETKTHLYHYMYYAKDPKNPNFTLLLRCDIGNSPNIPL